jgi:hypothetical protein
VFIVKWLVKDDIIEGAEGVRLELTRSVGMCTNRYETSRTGFQFAKKSLKISRKAAV